MPADRLDRTFAALADPTRRAILERLAGGQASVTELAEPFRMSLPAVSKHLKVLERAGLISRGREAQWRPCRLEAAPLKEVAGWVERYHQFWGENFDRLDGYLHQLQAQQLHAKEQQHDGTRWQRVDGELAGRPRAGSPEQIPEGDIVSPAPKTVDDYLAAVPEEMRTRLEELRQAIRAAAPEAEEVISYQIPTYKQRGALVAFGAAKNHAGFYVMSAAAIDAHQDELRGYGTAKTTIRFPLGRPIPVGLVASLVKARIAENEAGKAT